MAKGFLGLHRDSHSLLPSALLHAHPGQVYWEVFLSLEAFGAVDNVALRDAEG